MLDEKKAADSTPVEKLSEEDIEELEDLGVDREDAEAMNRVLDKVKKAEEEE